MGYKKEEYQIREAETASGTIRKSVRESRSGGRKQSQKRAEKTQRRTGPFAKACGKGAATNGSNRNGKRKIRNAESESRKNGKEPHTIEL